MITNRRGAEDTEGRGFNFYLCLSVFDYTAISWLYTKRFYPIMNFTYDIKSLEGHLPTPRIYQHWASSTMWFEEAAKGLKLFSRLDTCKL
ncbi:MAG: hypothetical protein RLZZ507_1540 [Cyanobacteriota bacterium]|jgi:hypothetical protein